MTGFGYVYLKCTRLESVDKTCLEETWRSLGNYCPLVSCAWTRRDSRGRTVKRQRRGESLSKSHFQTHLIHSSIKSPKLSVQILHRQQTLKGSDSHIAPLSLVTNAKALAANLQKYVRHHPQSRPSLRLRLPTHHTTKTLSTTPNDIRRTRGRRHCRRRILRTSPEHHSSPAIPPSAEANSIFFPPQ
jgi:hypothetical protein